MCRLFFCSNPFSFILDSSRKIQRKLDSLWSQVDRLERSLGNIDRMSDLTKQIIDRNIQLIIDLEEKNAQLAASREKNNGKWFTIGTQQTHRIHFRIIAFTLECLSQISAEFNQRKQFDQQAILYNVVFEALIFIRTMRQQFVWFMS